MAENSKIQWTDHTFNPWRGCSKVSAGCANCYAEKLSKRNPEVLGEWGDGGTRVIAAEAQWKKPLQWQQVAVKAGKPAKVFCASLADVFEDRPELEPPRLRLLDLIRLTPDLRWMLLTKRPENWLGCVQKAWKDSTNCALTSWLHHWWVDNDPPANVAIGTSVEDQEQADKRIMELIEIPARTRFLSCEPLLEKVDLWDYLVPDVGSSDIHMVIVGGESGPNARPFEPHWARSIQGECVLGGVPFFMKQMSGFKPTDDMIPEDLMVREWPEALVG